VAVARTCWVAIARSSARPISGFVRLIEANAASGEGNVRNTFDFDALVRQLFIDQLFASGHDDIETDRSRRDLRRETATSST
jgi:hypothetical protein